MQPRELLSQGGLRTPRRHASATTPTRYAEAGGVKFAFRELATPGGVPLVMLHHFTATIDDWDPRVLDGVAAVEYSRPGESIGVGSTFRLSRPGNSPRCRVVLADPPHRLHWVEVADDGLAVSVEFSISPDEVGGTILTHTKTMLRHGAVAAPPTGMRHYR
jgi:hypothetical protein